MLVLSYAVLTTSLMTIASAAVLAPIEPREHEIQPRQIDFIVPTQCLPVCDSFVNAINRCVTAACACTAQNLGIGESCVQCAVTYSQYPSDVVQDKMALNNYVAECAAKGYPLGAPNAPNPPPPSPTYTPPRTTPTAAQPTGIPTYVPTTYVPTTNPFPTNPFPTTSTSTQSTASAFNGGGGVTPSTASTPSLPTTGSGSLSGAMGVGNRAIVLRVFSVCLAVVLMA